MRHPHALGFALLAATIGTGLAVRADTGAAPAGEASQQAPTFRSTTTVVEVDVIARDAARRFVGDLTAADFEVLDDGKPAEITTVYRVVGPKDLASESATAVAAPSADRAQRTIVLYFDHLHMAPGSLNRAKKAALDFLEKDFRSGDVGGVLDGARMANGRLTSRREELEAAVKNVKATADAGVLARDLRQWPRFLDVVEANRVVRNEQGYDLAGSTMLGLVTSRACRDQPDQCEGEAAAMVENQVHNKAIQLVGAARSGARQTIDTLNGVTNGLARLPGRKTVVMMTEGFFTEDSWGDLRGVVERAARGSVRIYAVDTRGLDRGSAGSDILSAATPARGESDPPSMGDTNADGPNSLAVDTGGFVVRNENDFGKAFADIDRDTSSYYIVGFRPNRSLDGKYHSITVRVARAGVSTRARKGYIASAAATPGPEPAASAGSAPGTSPSSSETANPSPGVTPVDDRGVRLQPDVKSGSQPDVKEAAPAAAPPTLAVRARPAVADGVHSLGDAGAKGTKLPADVLAGARAGWDAYQRGDVKAAREALRPVAAHREAPAWTRYVLGWSEYASGDFAAATAQWERVRDEVPQFEPVYFDLADGLLQQREFGRALSVLRDAQKRWPKDVEVHNAVGVVQVGRGAFSDAIKTFEDAVTMAPADATATYNLAKSLELRYLQMERLHQISAANLDVALRDRDRAVDFYRQTIQLGGSNVEAAREGLRRLGIK
jgi:VWFA-related protein